MGKPETGGPLDSPVIKWPELCIVIIYRVNN